MRIINHKNRDLSICQRLFIEKSVELLYLGSIDSYRVRLHNPKTILEEIKYCLEGFQQGRIKHFNIIKSTNKDKNALIDEAITMIKSNPNYLDFTSISQEYIVRLMNDTKENNYKKIINGIEIVLAENSNYLLKIINGIEAIILENKTDLENLEKLENSINILFSELISLGFSKGFLYKLTYGIFINSLTEGENFTDHFISFRTHLLMEPSEYMVVFQLDTSQKVYNSISNVQYEQLIITDTIDDIRFIGHQVKEFNKFKITKSSRKFIRCKINATDYLAALKKARSILSEYLDVINLGLTDEFLLINKRALVFDIRFPEKTTFQSNKNILDGRYQATMEHYQNFTLKLPSLLNSTVVQNESKEKIKSAIRYLRLGNESTEVEHKFINYWLGLEYIFSNNGNQNTINRVKEHFINAHVLAYIKRNTYSFKKEFGQIPTNLISLVPSYKVDNTTCLSDANFYLEAGNNLLNHCPLLAYRALKLHKSFFTPNRTDPPKAKEYLKKHERNLEIHFTRIYMLRNEIIHEAATNTNNEHIAANLRYYLTFILNELIDFLSRQSPSPLSIESYFILNEIKIGNIENSGFLLQDLLNVDCSIDFISN